MLKKVKNVAFILSLLGISFANASPIKLVINDHDNKKNAKEKLIFSAHKEIPHNLSIAKLRFALLEAAISNIKIKWVLEEEGENYMLFRWDYRGDAIISRVEFNESLIQMKYENAFGDFVCKKNVKGICYKNYDSDYYLYMKRFRTSILDTIKAYQRG